MLDSLHKWRRVNNVNILTVMKKRTEILKILLKMRRVAMCNIQFLASNKQTLLISFYINLNIIRLLGNNDDRPIIKFKHLFNKFLSNLVLAHFFGIKVKK